MTNASRRDLFKTASAGIASAMLASAPVMAKDKETKLAREYDVVVVGAGCGGLVTAVRCAQNGLRTILVEKMGRPAGNTIYAAGYFLGVNTPFQKGKDLPEDSVEAFYEDMMKVSRQKGDKTLTRIVATKANHALEWLHNDCGVEFKTGIVLVWPMLGRSHIVKGPLAQGGANLVTSLLAKAKELGVHMAFKTKVVDVLTNKEKGGVAGVRVKDASGLHEIKARLGVVLATGGFSANQQMVTGYIGSAGAKMPIRGSHVITGENIRFSDQFFARVVNVDQYHCGPIYGPTGANPLFIVNNGVIVDQKGKRYTNEGLTYVQISRDTAAMTPLNFGYVVTDKDAQEAMKVYYDNYRRTDSPLYEGATVAEAAKKAGLDVDAVVRSVEEYNAAIEKHQGASLTPPNTNPRARTVTKPPFIIVPFQGGMTATFGGPLINKHAQVYDTEGALIDGLYAVGNAAGGLFYDNYVGGAQLTSAAVFGLECADHLKTLKK